MSVFRALMWSMGAIAVGIVTVSPARVAAFVVPLLIAIAVRERSPKAAMRIVAAIIPFSIPLLIMHGILNPQFPITSTILGVPLRSQGLAYAAATVAWIGSWTTLFFAWIAVPDGELIWSLHRLGIPRQGLTLVMFTQMSIQIVRRRVSSVLLAQRSRGIRTTGPLVSRLLALQALALPVVTSTISEADKRGAFLESRGSVIYVERLARPLTIQAREAIGESALMLASMGLSLFWR